MLVYRIKQFYWALESLFIKEDYEILNKYLDIFELNLFMKISKSERNHSIRVCRAAMKFIKDEGISNIDEYIMCKCALLHDIGKSQAKLNTIYKSIFVIVNSITCGKFLKYNKNKKLSNYYNHSEVGAKLLEDINSKSSEVVDCVRYHHNKEMTTKNVYLEILIMCDNCN